MLKFDFAALGITSVVAAVRFEAQSFGSGVLNGVCYGGEGECRGMNVQEVAAIAHGHRCSEDLEIDLGKVYKARCPAILTARHSGTTQPRASERRAEARQQPVPAAASACWRGPAGHCPLYPVGALPTKTNR